MAMFNSFLYVYQRVSPILSTTPQHVIPMKPIIIQQETCWRAWCHQQTIGGCGLPGSRWGGKLPALLSRNRSCWSSGDGNDHGYPLVN